MRKVRLLALSMGFLAFGSLCMAADPQPVERPDWCKPGFVCLSTKDSAALLIKVDMLEEQVGILKANRARHLGLAAVCGPSASLSVDSGSTTLAGTLSCTIGIGWRF